MDALDPALYNCIYAGISRSRVYRTILAEAGLGLPDWLVALSATSRVLLQRIAIAMALNPGDGFVDFACGLGGPGLWIAQQTQTSVAGVDFSSTAIASAKELAASLGMSTRTHYATSDAAQTSLPGGAFDGALCIDSLQFMDAAAAVNEMARVLLPGAAAVVTTWEAVAEVELQTVVRDYRPFFEAAGFEFDREVLPESLEREMAYLAALHGHAEELRDEIGESAEPILLEAQARLRRRHQAPRVRKVFILARKS